MRKLIYPEKICIGCGISFSRKRRVHMKAWIAQKFCNHLCSLISRKGIKFSEKHKQKISLSNKGPQVKRTCRGCKNTFLVPEYVIKRKDKQQGIYCNRLCQNRTLAEKNKGENHPNWKGGVLPIHTYIRHSTEYKIWRMSVFKRDNFTCLNCNAQKVVLNADHIKPFSKIVKENNITNFEEALSCAELWDINNGRTLCKPCHVMIGWNLYKKATKNVL